MPALSTTSGKEEVLEEITGVPQAIASSGVKPNISSMPEAAGKAALLIDPTDPKSLTIALERVLGGKIRPEASKLKAQATKFSWGKAAEETLKILESVKNG